MFFCRRLKLCAAAAALVCSTQVHICAGSAPVFPTRPLEDTSCLCNRHPYKGPGTCYEPVCPAGYFKCCADCQMAPCVGTEADMVISYRGLKECIRCEPGDFCDGCDVFQQCPPSTHPGREGPRYSRAGSTRVAACEVCGVGEEASIDLDTCVSPWRKSCNEKAINRCRRGCYAENPQMGKKLTPCEKMKCTMYCAKMWSDACAVAMGVHCTYLTELAKDDAFRDAEDVPPIDNCDVDCGGTPAGRTLAVATAATASLALALSWL